MQAILAFIFGVPPSSALFMGGAQTWLQRIWQIRGRLCWDWVALPLLIICLDSLSLGASPIVTLGGAAALFFCGILAQFAYSRLRAEQIHTEKLAQALARLKAIPQKEIRPEQVATQAKMCTMQVERFAKAIQGKVSDYYAVIEKIEACAKALAAYVESSKPSKSSGWATGLLRSEHWGKGDNEGLLKQMRETNALLEEEIRKLRSDRKLPEDEFEAKLQGFEEQAQDLVQKASLLPGNLAGHVTAISQTTLEIIKNMRSDPADRTPGDRFLSRYLPAVHTIIEEHVRLSSGPIQGDIQQALDKSAAMLERMDNAFREELANLLQNDAINFSAEVDAIDVMLKMKGR
ncbi:MAG: 5-bromo-4-chloroindolyl phosphate hydrolysis family protein [Desulfovibrionaceae bacterium]|nr:5-bromo-4-chloroindolyl phosphate hydrolysis family protein [Desulfovibrionaceae bacterium]